MTRDLPTFRAATTASGVELPPRDAPAGELERVVNRLAAIAEELAKQNPEAEVIGRLSNLGRLHGPSNESALTPPLRAIVSHVVAAWTAVYSPPLAERGTQIGKYKLGAPFEQGGFGRLFAIDEPLEMKDKFVIKVLHRNSSTAARRFLEGSRFNKELCDYSYDYEYVVKVTEIIDERPRPAYVMRKYRNVLEKYLSKDPAQPASDFHTSSRAFHWTELAAMHIGRALRGVHVCGRCHGDVKPTNILVSIEDGVPTFRLGDFDLASDLASDDTVESSAAPLGIVPLCLALKARSLEPRHPGQGDSGAPPRFSYSRQWSDIAALSLILYRMLTGEVVDPRNTVHLADQIERLKTLACEERITSVARRIIQTVLEVFEPRLPTFTIDTFLGRIHPSEESQEVRILFLGANPSNETQLALTREVTEIRDWLKSVPNGKVYRIEERWEVRADQLHHPILEIGPHILHFSGHGNTAGELIFHAPGGAGRPAPIEAITNVFRILRDRVRCVVLSACYSEQQARAIAEHIDVVIGMTGAIPDEEAIQFAGSFYGALARGAHVREAFDLACNGLNIAQFERRRAARDVGRPPADGESPIPQIHVRAGFDAKSLYFVKRKTA